LVQVYSEWKKKYVLSADPQNNKPYTTRALADGINGILKQLEIKEQTNNASHFLRQV
jgi:hypothetical protein